MKFIYRNNQIDYIVKPISEQGLEEAPKGGNLVLIEFVARVDGGKGRMPKNKWVGPDSLQALVDFETAKKLLE